MRNAVVRLIYGQGGKGPLSAGFILFGHRLRQLGYAVIDDVTWKYPDTIAYETSQIPADKKVVLLGYSLGANCTSWVAHRMVSRPIDLIVAYDPSQMSYVDPIPKLVKRAICYRNTNYFDPTFFLGHAKLVGPTVEDVPWTSTHGAMCYDPRLHEMTLAALKQLETTA